MIKEKSSSNLAFSPFLAGLCSLVAVASGCATTNSASWAGAGIRVLEQTVRAPDSPRLGLASGTHRGDYFDRSIVKRVTIQNGGEELLEKMELCGGDELKFNVLPHHEVWADFSSTARHRFDNVCRDVTVTW
jgi:hypothetical protein